MSALTTKVLSDDGSAPTFVEPGVSDTAQVGSGLNTFLIVKAASAAATVEITPPGKTSYGVALPKKTVAVAADGEAWLPLRREYADETGRATVKVTGAGATVAVVRVG